jgi:membrane AbrB-like protein
VLVSLVLGGLLEQMRLPAALMLGPLAAAVLIQTAGASVRVPRVAMLAAQTVIGCLVARAITPTILAGFAHHGLLFVSVILLSVSASALIGWTISFFRIIPGSTAVWGMLPGAATVMMVMAEAHGADFRLVAFMQYLRVVMVAAAASIVAVMFVHGGALSRPASCHRSTGQTSPRPWRWPWSGDGWDSPRAFPPAFSSVPSR